MKRRKIILATAGCAIAIAAAVVLWKSFAAPTRIAFVNYQAITLGQIGKANDNPFVKLSELPVEEIDRADSYDLVLVNGMGLRITDEQRSALIAAAEAGTPVLTTAATNPQNNIVSVDSVDAEFMRQYLAGGRGNYRNMLRYARKFIDGKRLFTDMPDDPATASTSLLYYPEADGDSRQFASVAAYEAWLRHSGKWSDTAPKVILTGQMGVPDSLVASLERRGCMVYPVSVVQQFIARGHADSIAPSAMINMAHGRMGDAVVRYLADKNIPLFAPLNANRPYSEWAGDKMGMNGGFLSQSVVTPEIDGAIRPYTLFAHFDGDDGLPCVAAIPDRLEEFTETVSRYAALRTKPNADKRLAIFYFKGPGQNALVAEGMEVAPSLFNLLTRLKREGYRVEGLPATAEAFEKMICARGKVFNS
ncbi:MAG: cobaltochelatase subunit CobN, partial [Muribaculaceae bacterium]|nr:cobaltochelatase subunit CobN [Muribaculaceae bacterium]